MGNDYETARALARGWWELDVAERARRRGHANCDASAGHKVAVGEGCLCNPLKPLTRSPDLVCEACFHQNPYEPWDGGKRLAGGAVYLTIDEALAPIGRKVERPPASESPLRKVAAPPAPTGLRWPRALLLCLIFGAAGGAIPAVARATADTRPQAAGDGALLGLACGLTAWLVGLVFRRADIAGRGLGTSPDRPEAAWRLTPTAAFIGGFAGVGATSLTRFVLVGFTPLGPYFDRASAILARLNADPIATAGIGAAVAAVLATLLPWARVSFRGLGRGAGSVDGQARVGALLGAAAAGGLTGGVLSLRPELITVGPGPAAPWAVYGAPVAGFLIGSAPRNALVRGLAGALAGYAAVVAAAVFWRPEIRPEWAAGLIAGKWWDVSRWTEPSRAALCVGLPAAGALLGAIASRTLLRVGLALVASVLAGFWALLAGAWLAPGLTANAPGALEFVLTDVPEALGPRALLLGAAAGLCAVGGATLGFRRGAFAAVVGLVLAYGLAYVGFVGAWRSVSAIGPDELSAAGWRWSRWAGLPSAVLAPLAGYLLGRGRFRSLAGGALGYAAGLVAAVAAAEATGLDVAGALRRWAGARPLFWPAVVAASGVGGAFGVLGAVAVRAAGRRWSRLKYVNKFGCGWCGRLATRDARPLPRGPLFPVCGDPLCEKELGRLLADPTALSLIAGPLRSAARDDAPELPEAVRERATPGRMERLRRLAENYRPDEA